MFAETNTKEYFLRPSLLIPENMMRAVTHTVNDQQYYLGIKKKLKKKSFLVVVDEFK